MGGLRFYERKEIRDLLAYLRLVENPADMMGFRRVVNLPKRGIGEATVEKVVEYAVARGIDLLSTIAVVEEIPGLTGKAREGLKRFAAILGEAAHGDGSVLEMTRGLLEETGYLRELQEEHTPEAEARLENIEEFLALTAQFGRESDDPSLGAFLETVSLVADADTYEPGADAVVLMTLHAAKGLEFPVVFLAGLEEGVFPHARAVEQGQLEEERRLCYVGMTRAKERLYLTHAGVRALYGEPRPTLPSRFLREVPPELTASVSRHENRAVPETAGPAVPAAPKAKPASYGEGERVIHPKWGAGTVVGISGVGRRGHRGRGLPGTGDQEARRGLRRVEQGGIRINPAPNQQLTGRTLLFRQEFTRSSRICSIRQCGRCGKALTRKGGGWTFFGAECGKGGGRLRAAAVWCVMGILILAACAGAASGSAPTVTVNGVAQSGLSAALYDGEPYLAVSSLPRLHANVVVDRATGRAAIGIGRRSILIAVGSPTATVDGQPVPLKSAPLMDKGEIWLPAGWLTVFALTVAWQEGTNTLALAWARPSLLAVYLDKSGEMPEDCRGSHGRDQGRCLCLAPAGPAGHRSPGVGCLRLSPARREGKRIFLTPAGGSKPPGGPASGGRSAPGRGIPGGPQPGQGRSP